MDDTQMLGMTRIWLGICLCGHTKAQHLLLWPTKCQERNCRCHGFNLSKGEIK